MSSLIQLDFQGMAVGFTEDGWINATAVAERFSRRPVDWLALDSTQEYIATLAEISNCEKSSLLRTRRGRNGGTWLHPKLGVAFARWLDVRFAIWADLQIDGLLRSTHPHYDRRRARDAAASSYRVMAEILRLTRQDQGKATGNHHYINETRLVNWSLSGEFKALDREILAPWELALLASLEELNAVLLARGVEYAARKGLLERHAIDYRAEHRLHTAVLQPLHRATVGTLAGGMP